MDFDKFLKQMFDLFSTKNVSLSKFSVIEKPQDSSGKPKNTSDKVICYDLKLNFNFSERSDIQDKDTCKSLNNINPFLTFFKETSELMKTNGSDINETASVK